MRWRSIILLVALALAAGCGDGDEDDAGGTTTLASVPDLTLPPPPTADPDLLLFPPARTSLEHGGETPAAVLAASTEIDGAEIEEAVAAAQSAGYEVGPTDCDEGAELPFGFAAEDVGVYTVSVYFATDEDAQAAVAAFESRGTNAYAVTVQTFCLD